MIMIKVWTAVTFGGRLRGASAEADKVVLPKLGCHYRRYLIIIHYAIHGFVWCSVPV